MDPVRPLRVYLWQLPSPAIIVPAQTGITYCNQVNGVATEHRELEGFLLPFPPVQSPVFDPRWWERHFNRRIPGEPTERWMQIVTEIERALNGVLSSGELAHNVRVIDDDFNVEAWVRVSFDFPDDSDSTPSTIRRLEGVLTWENCD